MASSIAVLALLASSAFAAPRPAYSPRQISNVSTTATTPITTALAATTPVATTAVVAGAKQSFKGDGSKAAGWPTVDQWLSFDKLWTLNVPLISTGCLSGIQQNSAAETQAIKDGITKVAGEVKPAVDPRFILATIMQESHGCVRVGATASPGDAINNPGIMQDHNGPNNCATVGTSACSSDTITGMIFDGTNGTADGSGLTFGIKFGAANGAESVAQASYWASRFYNSGDSSYKVGDDLSNPPDATASYSSDIANRLIGQVF